MKTYGAVRTVAVILKVIGVFSIIGGILAIIATIRSLNPYGGAWGWLYSIIPILVGIGYIGAGQLLDLFVDMAHDVRAIRSNSSSQRVIVEEEPLRREVPPSTVPPGSVPPRAA